MSQPKPSKLIKRDESGHYQRVEIGEGSHSPLELQARADAAHKALEAAIAADSSKPGVVGDLLSHPAWAQASARGRSERLDTPESSHYDSIHGRRADKQKDDTGELSGKEKLASGSSRSGSVAP